MKISKNVKEIYYYPNISSELPYKSRRHVCKHTYNIQTNKKKHIHREVIYYQKSIDQIQKKIFRKL